MFPNLVDGDYVLARKKVATLGDIVLVRHASLGLIVKRICGIDKTRRYSISGDNVLSTPTEAFGPIPSDSISGVVYWRISPRGIMRMHPISEQERRTQ